MKTEKKDNDIVFEEIQEEKNSFGRKDKKKEDLNECRDERKEYLDGWQRARAEMVNLKKQHLEEKKLFTSLGKEVLLEELVPVLDNFNAAFSADTWKGVDENWRIGVEYIYKQFLDVLEKNGIREFGDIDDRLDFERYEVVEEIRDDKQKKGIVKIIQKGYKSNQKIIRPAKVQVNN